MRQELLEALKEENRNSRAASPELFLENYYLALHESMQALEANKPLNLTLELEIVFAIVRQYTALKDYRLSSYYLGYAYQLINQLNLPAEELTRETAKIDSELKLQQTLYVYHTFFSPNEPLANRQLNGWCSFAQRPALIFFSTLSDASIISVSTIII